MKYLFILWLTGIFLCGMSWTTRANIICCDTSTAIMYAVGLIMVVIFGTKMTMKGIKGDLK